MEVFKLEETEVWSKPIIFDDVSKLAESEPCVLNDLSMTQNWQKHHFKTLSKNGNKERSFNLNILLMGIDFSLYIKDNFNNSQMTESWNLNFAFITNLSRNQNWPKHTTLRLHNNYKRYGSKLFFIWKKKIPM